VMNKVDIAEAVHVDLAQPIQDLEKLRPGLRVVKTNCLAGEGVEARVAVVSANEGAHVIEKHPAMFQSADLVVMNKVDIAEAVNVDLAQPIADLQKLRPGLKVVKTNCLAGEGVGEVLQALGLA